MASKLLNKFKKTHGWAQALGCSDSDIRNAQEALGFGLPADFKDYTKEYGCVSFEGKFIWFGLNVADAVDIVLATQRVKEKAFNFPLDCFVLQEFGDGTYAVVNEKGEVFHFTPKGTYRVSANLCEYLDVCLEHPLVAYDATLIPKDFVTVKELSAEEAENESVDGGW